MKRFFLDFVRRGLSACWLGPVVLAILYLIHQHQTGMETLRVQQVCTGIFSLSALAFIAGGLNALYQIEKLPLMAAILIHGIALYLSYLGTYLLNSWLEWATASLLVFSGIFVIGYLVIWAVIYAMIRRNAEKVNQILKQKQHSADNTETD